MYVCIYVCLCMYTIGICVYVLPCAGDVQVGLSEGLGQPTNDWSQWAGEDATMP